MESFNPMHSRPIPPPRPINGSPLGRPPLHKNVAPISIPPMPVQDDEIVEEVHINKKPMSYEDQMFISGLQEFMSEYDTEDLDLNSVQENPAKMTKEQANAYLRLYNIKLDEKERINKLCDGEIERKTKAINLYREQQCESIDKSIRFFEELLFAFIEEETNGKRTKTVKLPYGNLSIKKQTPKFTYGDEQNLVSMMKLLKPELVTTKLTETVNKTELKKEGTVIEGKFYLGEQLIDTVNIEERPNKLEIKKTKLEEQ